MSKNSPTGQHAYVVAFRAPSAAMLRPDQALRINVSTTAGDVKLTLRTRHLDRGFEHRLPGDLWVDARGSASSLNEAISRFGNAAGSITPVLAFAANAAIADLEPELAYDDTPGLSKRQYFQSYMPDERPIIHVLRTVNVDASLALLRAVEEHRDRERIGRAIAQYRLALRHWRWGGENLATAHLYIGMETLTKAVVRARLDSEGMSEEQLALDLGIDPKGLGPCQSLAREVEIAVRRQILFQGDDQCYKDAKKASDGFEHGYMPFDEMRGHASASRDKIAKYHREAVLNLLSLSQNDWEVLEASPFDEPLGYWPIAKYLKGYLLGDSDELASPENEYPIMSWRPTIKSIEVSEAGEYKVSFDEHVTARLGEAVSFELTGYEVWKP